MDTSNPTALLLDLCRQGVELRLTEDRQRISVPTRALTPELRAALVAHKAELLTLLGAMDDYRGLLQQMFAQVASRKAPSKDEIDRFQDEQARLLDELGPGLLTVVFEATAETWRATMGACPRCGGPGNCRHPASSRKPNE